MPWFNKRRIAHMLVPDDVLKNVLFIGTKQNGTFRPSGTGFIVIYEEHGHQFMHLVTAEHVIYNIVERGLDVWCRANLSNGDAQDFLLGGRDIWTFHPSPGTTDVAVCPFNPAAHDIDYISFATNGQESVAGTVDVLLKEKIGLGEEIFIVDLFRDHHGTNRNIPIIRVGNISMMQGEPVFTKFAGYTDAYLIEARSIGGLSGSPVFVSMPPFRVVDGAAVATEGLQYYLLGLVHGHFDVRSINEDTVVDAATADRGSINTGIGIVIPVEKILDTLRHSALISLRQQREDEFRNPGALLRIQRSSPALFTLHLLVRPAPMFSIVPLQCRRLTVDPTCSRIGARKIAPLVSKPLAAITGPAMSSVLSGSLAAVRSTPRENLDSSFRAK